MAHLITESMLILLPDFALFWQKINIIILFSIFGYFLLKLLNAKLSKHKSNYLIGRLFEIFEKIRKNSRKFRKIQDFVTFCSI